MLIANIHNGDDHQNTPAPIEAPVVKRSPEVYRGLPWVRDVPLAHETLISSLVPPAAQPELPQAKPRRSWSPLSRTLLVAAIMLFVAVEGRLFLAGRSSPATTAEHVELVPAASAAMSPRVAIAPSFELIYDASGSMLAPAEGGTTQRWELARAGLQIWLNSGALPLEASFGMQSYGSRLEDACSPDTTVLPLAPYSFERAYNGIADTDPAAGGRASIAASLRAASTSLSPVQGSATIVLVGGGAEACGGDPAAEAAAFVAGQAQRQVHVIGVAVAGTAAQAQLRAIAEQGNGQYIAVSTGDELATALQQVTGKQ
jgi:hypothetical protein